ncbi:MAG TPA: CopG family transcriptional regulator [Solirubrobacteraceae bacterium]|nr:CopG family transcriptional regulator [Solirubrobacteraceae bacterium]
MRRTTISLPDELAEALAREARRRSLPASAIARDALTMYLGIGGPGEQRELPFAGLGGSGHNTTARDMEDLLEQEWARDARGS